MSKQTRERINKELFDAGQWTRVNNWVFTELLKHKQVTGERLKVFLFMWRKLVGFGKTVDQISQSQIREGTGLGHDTVVDAVQFWEVLGFFKRLYEPAKWAAKYSLEVNNINTLEKVQALLAEERFWKAEKAIKDRKRRAKDYTRRRRQEDPNWHRGKHVEIAKVVGINATA